MKELILFRYHNNFEQCIMNLKFMRKLNPDITICGMYGGDLDQEIPEELLGLLDYNYNIPLEDNYYKWKNGDLCFRMWFKDQGHTIDFDRMYLLEWDTVFLKPLKEIYPVTNDNQIALTKYRTYKQAFEQKWHWLSAEFETWEKQRLEAEERFGLVFDEDRFCACIMPGISIPKKALAEYVKYTPSSFSNDEARFCLYMSCLGFQFVNNGLFGNKNIFVASKHEHLTENDFMDQVNAGGVAFHPVRTKSLMQKMINLTS